MALVTSDSAVPERVQARLACPRASLYNAIQRCMGWTGFASLRQRQPRQGFRNRVLLRPFSHPLREVVDVHCPGGMLVSGNSVSSMIQVIRADLETSQTGVKRYRLRTVLRMAGFSRRGSRNTVEIMEGLHAAGIEVSPALDSLDDLDQMLSFRRIELRRPAITSFEAAELEGLATAPQEEGRPAEPVPAPPRQRPSAPTPSIASRSAASDPSAVAAKAPMAPAKRPINRTRAALGGCLGLLALPFVCTLLASTPSFVWLILLATLGWLLHRSGQLDLGRLGDWWAKANGGQRAAAGLGIAIVLAMIRLSDADSSDDRRRLGVSPAEQRLVATAEPIDVATRTPRPTQAPTGAATATMTVEPPTATSEPPSPTAPPPTQPPPIDIEPRQDQNCSSFPNVQTMQAWRRYWIGRGIANPGGLDGDGDGVACEDGEGGRPAAAPPPPPPPAAAPAQAAPSGCCKFCRTGKPCGDTCISRDKDCHVGPGCACGGG